MKVYVVQHHEDRAGEFPNFDVEGIYAKIEDARKKMNELFEPLPKNYDNCEVEIDDNSCLLTTEDGETINIDITEYEVE